MLSQFLGTSGGIVGNVGSECGLVADHAIEGATGADAFLLGQLLIRHHILSIQLLPGSDDVDVVKGLTNPCLMVLGKVVGCLTP